MTGHNVQFQNLELRETGGPHSVWSMQIGVYYEQKLDVFAALSQRSISR